MALTHTRYNNELLIDDNEIIFEILWLCSEFNVFIFNKEDLNLN